MRLVVGSETGAFGRAAGVDRVVRGVHLALAAELLGHGVGVVPVHTRPGTAEDAGGPFAAVGPGLPGPVRDLEDCDALLVLGLDVGVDFGRVLRERQRRDLPVVALVHDLMPVAHPEWYPPHARTHFRAYLQQLLHVADAVAVTTHTVRAELLDLGWRIRGPIHVVPLGTSYAQLPPTPAPRDPLRLLYVSTIAPHKGHLALLEAFDLVRASGVSAELTLVGREGRMAEPVTEAIRRHPEFGRSLTWTQGATDDDVRDLARRCRIGVVPSQAEGFGLFVDEALSLGLAVVANDLPVFRERDYPNLTFTSTAPAALAAEILRVRELPVAPLAVDRVRTLAAAGRDLAPIVLAALGR